MRPPPPDRACAPIGQAEVAAVCAATGDPSPLHLDPDYARAAGYPSVVAPGTMLLGWIGAFLADWAGGVPALASWDVRFASPLWLGDQVTLRGGVVDGRANVRAFAQDGRDVATATARFREIEP